MTTLRMYGTAPESIVDGPGLRFSVFVQGCTHHCPGCHNPESQPSDGGYLCEPADIVHEIHKNKLIHGVTLTGGEPFEQVEGVFELAQLLKAEGYDLWIYSGYLFEDLMAGHPHEKAPDLLALCDVLVDGPFVEALHSYDKRRWVFAAGFLAFVSTDTNPHFTRNVELPSISHRSIAI